MKEDGDGKKEGKKTDEAGLKCAKVRWKYLSPTGGGSGWAGSKESRCLAYRMCIGRYIRSMSFRTS